MKQCKRAIAAEAEAHSMAIREQALSQNKSLAQKKRLIHKSLFFCA